MTKKVTLPIKSILLVTDSAELLKSTRRNHQVVFWVKSLGEAIAYLAKYRDANQIYLDVSILPKQTTEQTIERLLLPYVPAAKIIYLCRSLGELSALELKREALFKLIEAET